MNKTIISTVDGFFIPTFPDMFSLYGIKNIGNSLALWQKEFNTIYNLISDNKISKFPKKFVQFIGFTIYIVKPNNSKSDITCEIQVRTLFEEIWGEIDHTINYPHETESIACREQIRVLAKLVSTGTRLADSIFRTYDDYMRQEKK